MHKKKKKELFDKRNKILCRDLSGGKEFRSKIGAINTRSVQLSTLTLYFVKCNYIKGIIGGQNTNYNGNVTFYESQN